jgi:hypothetical protein
MLRAVPAACCASCAPRCARKDADPIAQVGSSASEDPTHVANAASPASGSGEGATGARAPTPQPRRARKPSGGGFPPHGLPFGARAPAICIPLRLSPACFPGAVPFGNAMGGLSPRLERHCWHPAGDRRADLLELGPSRSPSRRRIVCTWDAGWRHPRPVAANDAPIISGSRSPPRIAGTAANPGTLRTDLIPRRRRREHRRAQQGDSRIALIATHGVRPCGSDP